MLKRNAYGVTITDVQHLTHPKGLRWVKVTWSDGGATQIANTYPGGAAAGMAEEHPREVPADIILNGRSQVIAVFHHNDEDL